MQNTPAAESETVILMQKINGNETDEPIKQNGNLNRIKNICTDKNFIKDTLSIKISRQKSQKKREICLIIVIILLIVNGAIQWSVYLSASKTYGTEDPKDDWCIPCDSFKLSPSFKEFQLKEFKQKKGKSNEELCCANKDTSGKLLTLYFNQKLRQERAKGTLCMCDMYSQKRDTWNSSYILPMGHVVGAAQSKGKRSSNGCQHNVSIKQWDTKTTGTILRRLNYRAGQIEIKVPGWYKVYSQVYYTYQPGHPNCSIYHYIYKHNPVLNGEDHLLFQSGKSIDRGSKGVWEYTSNVGGLIKLRRGDSLFVKASNPHLI